MGRMTAEGYAAAVGDDSIDLTLALTAHFTSNCYPSIPLAYVQVARDVIDVYNRGGDYSDWIVLPQAVLDCGQTPIKGRGVDQWGTEACRLGTLVAILHLEAFLVDRGE